MTQQVDLGWHKEKSKRATRAEVLWNAVALHEVGWMVERSVWLVPELCWGDKAEQPSGIIMYDTECQVCFGINAMGSH